jgi:hypothetical protein
MKQYIISLVIVFSVALGSYSCAIFSSISTSSQSADSISTSVTSILGSISKSVSSISKSSTPDKKDEEEASHYRKDVETLVSISTQDTNLVLNLEEDIERLARNNGVLDWRQKRVTYTAFGSGLRIAGYTSSQVQEILASSCPDKPEVQDAILEGYNI